jgi:hypothetical protein
MKVIVGKGKVVILIILVLLLCISLALLYLYQTGKLSLGSNYANLYTDCEEDGSSYKCFAFLEDITESDNKECFILHFVSSDYTLNRQEICEKKGNVQLNSEAINIEKAEGRVYPVRISFSPKDGVSVILEQTKISIERLSDEDANALVSRMYPNYTLGGLMTYEQQTYLEKGYSIYNGGENGANSIYIRDVKLEEISTDGNILVVKLSISLGGVAKSYTVKTEKFFYVSDRNLESSPETIDYINYSTLPLSGNYDVRFLYPESLGTDVEEYFTSVASSGVLLESFILSAMIKQ